MYAVSAGIAFVAQKLRGRGSGLADSFSELGERWQWLQYLRCGNELCDGLALAGNNDFLTRLGPVDESWQFLAGLLDTDVLHNIVSSVHHKCTLIEISKAITSHRRLDFFKPRRWIKISSYVMECRQERRNAVKLRGIGGQSEQGGQGNATECYTSRLSAN